MIYVKYGHGKWIRKDLDAFNGYNNFREMMNWMYHFSLKSLQNTQNVN